MIFRKLKDYRYLPIKKILIHHIPILIKVAIARYYGPIIAKIRPFIASIELTERCCLRCIMCDMWRKSPKEELTTKEWKSVFEQLKREGFITVGFTGGEVLLREDIFELASYAAKLGLRVGVVTNGYLLDQVKAKMLIDAGVRNITVSIDALGRKYDQIRGVNGAFEKVRNAAEVLSKIKKEKKDVVIAIGILLMKPTLDTLLDVVNFAKELEIPVSLNLIDYTPYYFKSNIEKKDFFWISEDDQKNLEALIDRLITIKKEKSWLIRPRYIALEYVKEYFRDPLRRDIPCTRSIISTYIDSEGKVYGGCWSQGIVGDLRKEKLCDILRSTKYKQAAIKRFKKNCPGCSCGYPLDLYYSIPHLLKEIKYALMS